VVHEDRLPVWFQRVESAAIAALAAVAFVELDFEWWYLVVLFLLFDLSMLGYLHSPRVGAWAYNTVHSFAGPAAAGIAGITAGSRALAFASLVWVFHIAVDRGLGYGLKFQDRFTHTHLGEIGRGAAADGG
jgi:hypothetical protein